eukprot:5642629-Alexandrium_andersonii.AAC.1
MSASLVGSEMCIRDRARAAPGGCPPWTGARVWPIGQRGGRPCWSSSASVSYTHLTLPTICSV